MKKLFLILAFTCFSASLFAQVSIGVNIQANLAPPALPVYTQPVAPADGYIWTPGYWAYGDNGYYWVPGVWVLPPRVGLLWTPAYWGYDGGVYRFHAGYWGPHVGFYGGINYGFGYSGVGFGGGIWVGRSFHYNTAVTNVNTTIVHNTYVNRTVINNTTVNNRVSYNGGNGIHANPSEQERMALNERHEEATAAQQNHFQSARADRNQWASVNHGSPATPALNRINERSANQQERIANGMKNGSLTDGESKNLESKAANINQEKRLDRNANGGTLTVGERNQINHQQDRLSNSIYQDKHNGNVQQYGNNPVGQRRYNQQQRIANGVGQGQISAGQAVRDENKQIAIRNQAHAFRAANGGALNPQQRRQVNHQQNVASRQIHKQRRG